AVIPAKLLNCRLVQFGDVVIKIAVDHDYGGAVCARLYDLRCRRPRRHHDDALQTGCRRISSNGCSGITSRHHRGGHKAKLLGNREPNAVAPVLQRASWQDRVVLQIETRESQMFAESLGMD